VNEIIILVGLILAAAAGYGSRSAIAKLDHLSADLEQVVIGFNRCDRCEFGGDHEAAAAHLGEALIVAAGRRGISRGQLLGFIALASERVGPTPAEELFAAEDLVAAEEPVLRPRRVPVSEPGAAWAT
jgi:hypothetical protein